MRKHFGLAFMLIGIALVLSAMLLLVKNRREEHLARESVNTAMSAMHKQIKLTENETKPDTEPEFTEYIPAEFLEPDDLIMTEKIINGFPYIGYLVIEALNLELPVMSDWNSARLQLSPCRYSGSLKGGKLVVMAHNYDAHFGRLSQLSEGSQVQFVDMDGNVWTYEVVLMDVLSADAVEEMRAGEYDLSLFTCASDRTHRITVRCNIK